MIIRAIPILIAALLVACSSNRGDSVEGTYQMFVENNPGQGSIAIMHFLVTGDTAYYLWFRDDVIVTVPEGVKAGANSFALETSGGIVGVLYPGMPYQAVGSIHTPDRPPVKPRAEAESPTSFDLRLLAAAMRMARIPKRYDDKPVQVLYVASFGPQGERLPMPDQ
jgi:hypothetical protein